MAWAIGYWRHGRNRLQRQQQERRGQLELSAAIQRVTHREEFEAQQASAAQQPSMQPGDMELGTLQPQ
jgi:hypothetical protein